MGEYLRSGSDGKAGLVDGSKLFMDSSMVKADASNNSVVNTTKLQRYLNKSYRVLEERLEEEKASSSDESTTKGGDANKKHISTTDPDASVVRRGHGRSKLQYQIHRGVDEKHEIITATEVTPGEVHESHCMDSLIDKHHENTGKRASTVVAGNHVSLARLAAANQVFYSAEYRDPVIDMVA